MSEPAVEAIARLVPATLRALHALEFAGRHLSPSTLAEVIKAVDGRESDVEAALAGSRGTLWPEHLQGVRDRLERSADASRTGIVALIAANVAPQPIVAAYRALRSYAVGAEAIYALAGHLKPVSQFFLEERARHDADLLARIAAIDPGQSNVGVMHFGGPPGTRGGFSLYVPEYFDGQKALPLAVVLHGGSGNGGAFLWSWLREARTRGFALVAPTARGSTWSLMEPGIDGPNIDRIVEEIAARWKIDTSRQLLTGMSDGGTFTYVLGLAGGCRFTHLAPVAAAFHPMMLASTDPDRLRGLPVHIVHGAQDWMFPAETAQMAHRTLLQAGAAAIYREVADLSHTYPRDENACILDWFMA